LSKTVEINERIKATQVRFIDENGVQKGIMSLREALYHAGNANLDLVKIADANPPVCKVVDAGKYLYEQQKQQKLLAKKQRENAVEVKEVQLRPAIDTHDLEIKARKARGFLADGDKVKVVVRLHGRERNMKHKGHEVISAFIAALGECKQDTNPIESGNQITVILASSVPKTPKEA
jgi:translation initiation factor IF-3